MGNVDQRKDERSRHKESESGGRVCVLCMEKREGWNWYLRLALVNGFFPAWHSRESAPDCTADNCGQVEQRGKSVSCNTISSPCNSRHKLIDFSAQSILITGYQDGATSKVS